MIKLKPESRMLKLKNEYLFTKIRNKTKTFLEKNGGEVINLGVGDIAYPLPKTVIDALVKASEEMGDNARFKGYPEETGYKFLKDEIVLLYLKKGIEIESDEIFIGDGSKSDASGITDVIDRCETLICSPVYPVYEDCAIMRGNKITYLVGNKQNNFLPIPYDIPKKPYIIWLCSPNNPTGGAYDGKQLKVWVDFALETGSLILYDSAYSSFINGMPTTIYEIKGANECAVELCSFSKSCGFTGIRCSWMVIPNKIKVGNFYLNKLWKRRQSTKFNGVSYITQRAAQAALSDKGWKECLDIIKNYKSNTRDLLDFLKEKGVWHTGGEHSPYIWFECFDGMNSWQMFDFLLEKARIVGTPGCGFGIGGEGFFRLSCFARPETVRECVFRLKKL